MVGIFISYRRADSNPITGRIYDRLITPFGDDNVFKDVDDIPPGVDFRSVVDRAVSSCEVMLVIIGRQWAAIAGADGQQRLADPADFVRIEVETGLQHDEVLVIPVLTDNAMMPAPGEIPESLHSMLFRNAVVVRHDPDFHRDILRLISHLELYFKLLGETDQQLNSLNRLEGDGTWHSVETTLSQLEAQAVDFEPVLNKVRRRREVFRARYQEQAAQALNDARIMAESDTPDITQIEQLLEQAQQLSPDPAEIAQEHRSLQVVVKELHEAARNRAAQQMQPDSEAQPVRRTTRNVFMQVQQSLVALARKVRSWSLTPRQLRILIIFLVAAVLTAPIIFLVFVVISYNNLAEQFRNDIGALATYQPQFQTVRVLDVNGELIAALNSEASGGFREAIQSLDDVSPEAIYAIVGSQEPRFFETAGFDPGAILGAFIAAWRGEPVLDTGNLTIAQQIAETIVIADNPSPLDTFVAASEIERGYSKNFILRLFLNEQSFGNQTFGIQTAANFYFGKEASELNLAEGALLAAILHDPANDPVQTTTRDQAFAASDEILRDLSTVGCMNFSHSALINGRYCKSTTDILKDDGSYVGPMMLERARVQSMFFPRPLDKVVYPHFVDYVRGQLLSTYGADRVFQEGFTVHTTLDPTIQAFAEDSLRATLNEQAFSGLQTGAVMVMNPETGAVLAMVGSPNYADESIDGRTNQALTWHLPGATILPLLYTAALEGVDFDGDGFLEFDEYLTPVSILFDLPPEYQNPNFQTTNSDGVFHGRVMLREALANNYAPVAVIVYDFVRRGHFIEFLEAVGIMFSEVPPQVSYATAIGDETQVRLRDMMQAYSVLASSGRYVPLRAIESIETVSGDTVALPALLSPGNPRQAVTPEIAFLVQDILSDSTLYVDGFQPMFLTDYPDQVGVKLNFLNDNTDMWAIGFSRNAVVGVWMGRADDQPTIANSRDSALSVWKAVMEKVLAGTSPMPLNRPDNSLISADKIVSPYVCHMTGVVGSPDCQAESREDFATSHLPMDSSQGLVVTALIDTTSGLLASDACRENVSEEAFVRFVPRQPGAINWLNTAAGRSVAEFMGLPNPVRELPTTTC